MNLSATQRGCLDGNSYTIFLDNVRRDNANLAKYFTSNQFAVYNSREKEGRKVSQ